MAKYGRFYSAEEVAKRLFSIAGKRKYRQLRVSGGEPTISRRHLISLLEYVSTTKYLFILETNGILLGAFKDYARDLSRFRNIHVRVSIKGCSSEEFSLLTGAKPEAYDLQFKALENLLDYSVSTHPAVMLSFCERKDFEKLIERLKEIDESLVEEFEPEYVFLYPHVVEILRKYGLKPKIAYRPDNIPEELI